MQQTILSWQPEEVLVALSLSFGLSLWGFVVFWRSLKRYRLIHDTPTSKIRSAAQGFVELFGRAKMLAGEPILSPLTRQPCCWWQYSIERRVRTGKSSHWSTIESRRSEGVFALLDGTGQALIDPIGAEVSGSKKKVWYGRSRRPADITPGLSALGGRYRYTERVLANGSDLYAMGKLQSQTAAGEFDLKQAVGDKLKRWKQDQATLLSKFDSNGDGELCIQEWQQARALAQAEVEQEYAHLIEQDPIHLISHPKQGLPFLLSSKPPQKLAQRFLWKTIAGAIGFLVCGAAGTWIASVREFI
mgnify:CR=1 FL=1